jgi:hypothetical protein
MKRGMQAFYLHKMDKYVVINRTKMVAYNRNQKIKNNTMNVLNLRALFL